MVASVLGVAFLALAPVGALATPRTQPAESSGRLRSDSDAVQRLQAAVEEARNAAFDARLLVVAFDTDGPSVVELEVSQSRGDLRVSHGEAWALGRSRARGYFTQAGELLQLGSVESPGFRPVRLTSKYAVRSVPSQDLDTGPAEPIEVIERDRQVLRERLYVDRGTGLVVRRETFDGAGEPVRLAVFTQVRLRDQPMRGVAAVDEGGTRAPTPLTDESLAILADVGWRVPKELPAGFELQGGYALPESEGGSMHLVYSDGLYTLSLYEQFGRLDSDSLQGAVPVSWGDVHAFTWPGSQPERMVWSGDGLTFTVVSDAPADALVEVTSELPHGQAPSLPGRMVRGLGRVLDWAWPFN